MPNGGCRLAVVGFGLCWKMQSSDWVLYVKAGCPWCVDAAEYLEERGYKYREINVLRDAEAFQRMKELSGQKLTPTLSINDGDLLLADFDTGQLEKFLKQHALQPG